MTTSRRVTLTPVPSAYRSSHIEADPTRIGRCSRARTPGPARTRPWRPRRARRRRRGPARLPDSRWRRTSSTSISAASSSGKPPTPGPEGDQGQRAGVELLGLQQRGGRGAADDVGRGRPAELHRRRVDDPARRKRPRGGLDRLTQPHGRPPIALLLDRLAAGAHDRPRHPAAVPQPRVGRVGDGIDLEGRDVRLEDLDRGRHSPRAASTMRLALTMPRPCCLRSSRMACMVLPSRASCTASGAIDAAGSGASIPRPAASSLTCSSSSASRDRPASSWCSNDVREA